LDLWALSGCQSKLITPPESSTPELPAISLNTAKSHNSEICIVDVCTDTTVKSFPLVSSPLSEKDHLDVVEQKRQNPEGRGQKDSHEIPINLDHLHEISRGDNDFQQELLQIFLEDGLAYLEKLKLALSVGDYLSLAYYAHQLKGASATIGMQKMPDIAQMLESQAEKKQLLGASELLIELEQVLECIQAFLANK
jgi:HPt (histidine-containing phosphotransfer) domain-containing protein